MAGITVRPNWAVKSGGLDPALGLGIVYDGAGGALVTGYFMGVASFGSMSLTSKGASDAFVAHVTTSGAIDWAVQAGGASHDPGYGITHDGAGGALVTGFFSGNASFGSTLLTSRGSDDAFIMHVTASGAIDWAVQAGGASVDHSCGIAHDGAGGALVTGYFSGNASFGSTSLTSLGSDDAFVAHVTASGAFDWAVQAGGSSLTSGRGIAYEGAGGALVTGYFCGKVSFGSTFLTSRGSTDAFVMHVTASGAIDWALQAGGVFTYTEGYGIVYDGAGGALVTGDFSGQVSFGSTSLTSRGSADAFVAHVTASGAFDWAVQAGGASVDHGWAIAHDGAGGALVTGYFSGNASFGSTSLTSRGSDDAFILHVTASGAIEWAVQAGGASVDQGRGIAHDGAGGALVTGYLSGNASFGSTTLTSLGNAPTCFVASLRPPASHCYVPPSWCSSSTCTYPRTAKCDGYTFTCCESIGIMCSKCPAARQPPLSPAPLLPPELPLPPRPPQPPTPRMPLRRLPPPSAQEHESPSHRPPPGSPLESSLTPAVRGTMALFEQPALVVSAIATSLALLGLLVCVYRRSRRVANNFRVSLDRAQLDLQLLEHRFKQQAHPQWHESTWSVRPPSESPPISIPPGPPSSRGHNGSSDDGSAAGSAAGSSRASPSQDAQGICRPKVDVEAWRVHGLAAAQGDAAAQYQLGAMHGDGLHGPKNEAEARRLYSLAAAQGHAGAQYKLGVLLDQGRGGPKDEAEARRLYGLASTQGHATAQYNLGAMHAVGRGGPKNEVEARRLCGLAATQGHADAQYNLGVMHADGRGGPRDEAKARRLYGFAAAQGHADAQYLLARLHTQEIGGPKDEGEARRLYGLAAAQGHTDAQYSLGVMHADGRGGPKNEAEARLLYGLAAANGHGDAQHSLGVMHAVGRGGAKNEAEARRLLGLAAARGHAGAQYSLGVMHADGHGGPKNEAEARRLYGLAAAQGHAAAQHNLAVLHAQGRGGGPKDEVEARRLLSLAAAQAHCHAQYNLATMHIDGRGGPKDEAEARRLYGLAAAQGHAAAQYHLAVMLVQGRGGPKDEAEARLLLGLAAVQGDPHAQYSLGNIHSLGLGGPKDEVEARRLLGLAAAQGHAAAQYDLGILHADGRGGPKDEVEGRRLLGLAAAQGDERAVLRMEQSANAMAEALLAEELADKAKLSARKKKKKKGSEQVRLEIITDESEAAECEVADDSKGDAAASDAAATSHPEASNAALREAIASGDCDTLTAALAEHRAHGSDSLVAEATSIRNRLRERKKKESQRQRRAHASAMTAHAELQSAQLRGDADALREALDSADAYTDALPGLEAEVISARARLEQLALQEAVSPVLVETAALPAAASSVAVVLTFGELESATDCFAPERLIGKGGFGLVYRADAIASLPAERRPPTLRATGLAVKRASTVLELRDFETEVAILQSCAHAHLLPLLGVCEEPACLVFPLMVGGSLQARLDLDPRDVAYLQAMGHFVQAPPKPLTWRQRLRAVMQATEALVYLHTPHERKPRTLHRDFKPANILLDHDLHAYLGDTGFAKAARQSGEFSRHSDTTTGRIMCSPGYADIDVLNGEYSELTDGFAVGVTLLVVLTRRDPVRIVDVIEEEHDAEMDDIPAEQLAEPSANWPSEVARALKELHKGLCLLRARRRLRLPDALQTLSALLEAHPTSSQMHQQPEATAASSVTTRDSDASASTTYEASPLSLQVRRMRAEDGPELSVQRNVTDAFSTCMRRLATLYKDAEAQTPGDFDERINYWHEACGLPEEVHTRLHTLRRWRNMSEHHLDQPERWASKGPSAKVASEHIAELQVRIDALTFGAARVSDHHRAHAAECAPSLSLPGKGGNTKPNTR